MPSNKNQHFVPKCHLKQFATPVGSGSISLFNIGKQLFVQCAPIKYQCSKDYFYGKDFCLETPIQELESAYGALVSKLFKSELSINDNYKNIMRMFWLFQYYRTEAAAKRTAEILATTANNLEVSDEKKDIEIDHALNMTIDSFVNNIDIMNDLKIILLRNCTDVPFITSDDPAILRNPLYETNHKIRKISKTYGLSASGNLMLMPLSPSYYLLGYDSDTYSTTESGGYVKVDNKLDAHALNKLQHLYCFQNIYGLSATSLPEHKQHAQSLSSKRVKNRFINIWYVEDENGRDLEIDRGLDTHAYFRKTTLEECKNSDKTSLFRSSAVYPEFNYFFKFLKRKSNAIGFSNGSHSGFVRKDFATYKNTTVDRMFVRTRI